MGSLRVGRGWSLILGLLTLPTAALAQPELPLPEREAVELPDLSGHWLVPAARGGEKGSVVLGAGENTPHGTRYEITYTLPSGEVRTGEGVWNGRVLEVRAAQAAAASPADGETLEPAGRRGAADALDLDAASEAAVDAPDGATSEGDQADAEEELPEVGTYLLRHQTVGRGRSGTRARVFEAQGEVHPDGPMPVGKFGRAQVNVAITLEDGSAGPFEVAAGESLNLKAALEPATASRRASTARSAARSP
jgi:hypothetical protein